MKNVRDVSTSQKSLKAIEPMLATLTGRIFDSEDWLYELKWDGYRTLAYIQGSDVQLLSRNGSNFNLLFADIKNSLHEINFDCILDGEVVALDKHGKPDFNLLQQHHKNPNNKVVFYVFDVLHFEGHDMKELPLINRKKILSALPLPKVSNIKVVDYVVKEGNKMFQEALKQNVEGIIAKKTESTYNPGRSHAWLKIKNYKHCEAIIIGYTTGGKKKYFGAMLLGYYQRGKLKYIGKTGTGFSEAKAKDLISKFDEVQGSCMLSADQRTGVEKNVVWLKPTFVCRIQYQEITAEGMVRQCVYQYLVDKPAKEITAIC